MEGVRDTMRNPNVVLGNLSSKALLEDYKFDRIYRNLYNEEFFLVAYSNIYHKPGNMTPGTDGKTVDGMSLERIQNLIAAIKDESYQPKPAKRIYIDKKKGGKRPLGIPSFDDKLVQEVIRMMLEALYEGKFSKSSHGFRPKRSCHTALQQCKNQFTGAKWFVEGDIKGFFDNINHKILIGILRRTINDDKFIRLIWKFLKAGYLEQWKFHNTYSGTPQGGIISPILANIYLNELDMYMEEYKGKFDKGNRRGTNNEYTRIRDTMQRRKKKLDDNVASLSDEEKNEAVKEIKSLRNQMLKLPYNNPLDKNYRRLQYVRYADDFILGVIGNKEDATNIKKDITSFLESKLKLELSQEKTLITNTRKKANFLGYGITINRNESTSARKDGKTSRYHLGRCELYIPFEAWRDKLLSLDALEINGDKWSPKHRTYLKDNDDLEILSIYNSEIRGMYQYYKYANNASVLQKFKFVLEYSMYKTYANKYKTSVSKVISKFKKNGSFGVSYETKEGVKFRKLYDEGFRKVGFDSTAYSYQDELPNTLSYTGRGKLTDRLKSEKCEYCGKTDTKLEMHHTRKLKDLSGRKKWEQFMLARRRKTLALCLDCHDKLHAGKLD